MSRMTINGAPVEFELDPRTPLLYALREAANLTGTKSGGGQEDCECGVCLALVDGVALRSCRITLAEAEGREITTIEGLSRDRSHPMQQAMVAEQAIQSGYNTSALVIAGAALLERNPAPSEQEIIEALDGIYCRDGTYPRLVRTVQRAGRIMLRQESVSAAPASGIRAQDAAAAVPALSVPETSKASSDSD
ncbi:MAG: (2Fe-2S)-binding protein [Erythrobacter sp.]|uniref:(2Fe-2S)-binding protein n=1 Tax=Erythrobacter sp. TaxID=1042 RepID=UPI00262475E0|nr:(2Fe-2S)-binding protein [Erythrobacter sp.]MDJ0978965.1 (2Fe-2S)-binding protein [Erythrobacter sp.]